MRSIQLTIGLCLFSLSAIAQTLFIAEASRYKVSEREEFRVTFTLNADGEDFRPPSGWEEDFYILSGPMPSVSTMNINGRVSHTETYTYSLRARKSGNLTIGEARINVRGEPVYSKPIQIEIVREEDIARDPNDPLTRARELAFIRIFSNKQRVYPGEPVVVQHKLYTRVNLGQIEMMSEPKWTGFVRENIDIRPQLKRENVQGKPMNTAILKAYVLIPQNPGRYTQAPAEALIPTPVPTGQRNFWGQQMAQTVNNIVSIDVPDITVKEFPDAGRPAGFDGAVGQYAFNVELSRNEIGINESATLKVTLRGAGNLSLVNLPKPVLPEEIEIYEPERKDDYHASMNGIQGSISEEFVLVPRYRGTYKIPALTFHYFDPKTEQYVTIRSEDLQITVSGEGLAATPVSPGEPNVSTQPAGADKRAVQYQSDDIRWIHSVSAMALDNRPFYSRWWFVLGGIVAAGLTLYTVFYPIVKRWISVAEKSEDRLRKRSLAGLDRLKARPNDWAGLEQLWVNYLTKRFGLRPIDLTRQQMLEKLQNTGQSADRAGQAYQLLNECLAARYASGISGNYTGVLEEIQYWIQKDKS